MGFTFFRGKTNGASQPPRKQRMTHTATATGKDPRFEALAMSIAIGQRCGLGALGGDDTPWRAIARPEQLTPSGDWRVWLILAGRGWGKTRTGAEDVKAYGLENPGSRIAILAPTFPDARDTCVEGESGLLNILPQSEVQSWNRSIGELVLKNSTRYKLFSGDKPERLRGPQHHRAWVDEPASFRYPQSFDMLMFGLRLGYDPRAVVTGTPKPVKLVKDLIKQEGVVVTRGTTYENRANLAPAFFSDIIKKYEGTRLGRQELNAEILEDNPNALWQRDQIEKLRLTKAPALKRICTAVDPSATASGNEAGIITAGVAQCSCKGEGKTELHGFVLDDASLQGSPERWAQASVSSYNKYKADALVAESNNGGEMVRVTIGTVQGAPPVKLVHASRGKHTRAEPVSALYEQDKVHHVGLYPSLEDELTEWEPSDKDSPNRLDALVWALTFLMLGKREVSWA